MSTHRARVEKYIGRALFTERLMFTKYPEYKFCSEVDEVVHHIDADRSNNDLSNLYMFRNNRQHTDYHLKVKNWANGLCGKSYEDKVECLKSFPDLHFNLDKFKELHEKGLTLSYYLEQESCNHR